MNLPNSPISYVGFCVIGLLSTAALAQDQRIADSLKQVYQNRAYADSTELELLRGLAFNEIKDYDLAMSYADELIRLSSEKGDLSYVARGYLQKGAISRLQGNLDTAIELLFKSAETASKAGKSELIGGAYISIADIYSVNGNSNNAILYYNKAIELLRSTPDTVTLATALLNAGDEYFNSSKYDSASLYFEESGVLFEKVNYPIGKAYNLGNIGMVYASTGQNTLAESNINEAIAMLEELEDYYAISVYLTYMSDIYQEKGDAQTALNYANRSLELARKYGLKEQISDGNLKLAELYEQRGDLESSYQYYKDHIVYRDSVNNIQTVQQIADLRTEFEVSQKQVEVDLLEKESEISQLKVKRQRFVIYATGISLAMVMLLALGAIHRYKYVKKTNRIIEEEKNRSEDLLLNILPQETAQELMENGKVKAKKFESATVLFSDFKGFTKLAEQVDPEQLVRSIDFYFKAFDEITTKYRLEKIKTIGDSYMCAGGLPTESHSHARDVVGAARDMIDLVKREWDAQDGLVHFEIRIGVHTGPVIAGIVGIKKWQYDIWGDTVNIASRMESNSEPGMINLSETTYQEIQEEFSCTYRGEIDVKNRGSLKMYFLN